MANIRKFRALEARTFPASLGRASVEADEVFEVDLDGPQGSWAKGLKDQPYFEDVTPAKRPTKEKD